ncbi:MAG: lactate utilization protein [Lachnospiraceae bacterium]|nr:lactate utilization protein [Ruminococcus sp.]MCM1274553.1 lactate utilization protein [Lachnospiraceae bacterium]
MDEKIQRTMDNLRLNKMKPYFAERRTELFHIIGDLVKNDGLITSGGSMTLKESGVIDFLHNEFGGAYIDRSAARSPEETQEIMRRAFVSDTFLTSSNAITEDGELYNVDGNGNRVSAMIFGPKQVIVVAGVNKIVKNLAEAKERVEKIAAPKNTARLNCETPCAKTGECMHCRSSARICCSYVTLAQQRVPDRIKVILVNEDLGY